MKAMIGGEEVSLVLGDAVISSPVAITPPGPYPVITAPNAAAPLDIPTYVGDAEQEITHPDVIDTYHEIGPGQTWNGYRYWMAATPFPEMNDDYENPCIYCSHDGTTWDVPPGGSNPVAPMPATGYNSDTDLVIVEGTMYLFWRAVLVENVDERYRLRTSTDGVTWTAAVDIEDGLRGPHRLLSPSVQHDGQRWWMWSVDIGLPGSALVVQTAEVPTGQWSAPAGTVNAGSMWHVNVVRHEGRWFMLAQTSGSSSGRNSDLAFGVSTDGIHWTRQATPILARSAVGWDSLGLYRSALQPVLDQPNTWRLWYASRSDFGDVDHAWLIGETIASPPEG